MAWVWSSFSSTRTSQRRLGGDFTCDQTGSSDGSCDDGEVGVLRADPAIEVHERIAQACADRATDRATQLVHDNWDALGRLIETAFADETAAF